jgi:hypothetical protein
MPIAFGVLGTGKFLRSLYSTFVGSIERRRTTRKSGENPALPGSFPVIACETLFILVSFHTPESSQG